MEKERYVRDPIHGIIYLPSLAWKIIDTPLFQRSRRIKQLGTAEYVFPGAMHSRFSHMIGTAHLAIQVCKKLNITGDDMMIVVLSGLLHDIGHAPMSHIYEQAGGSSHESRGKLFIDFLSRDIPELMSYSSEIKKIINGDSDKAFMAQIISNNVSGLDIDKFDYILRDCYFTGIKCTVNIDRIICGMSILNNNIVYSKKIIEDIVDVFRSRYDLHKKIYKHRVVRNISLMICDIFKIVNYEPQTIHEWVNFTDDWFNQLRLNNSKVSEIFNNLDNRNLLQTKLTSLNDNDVIDFYTIDCGYKGQIYLDNGEIIDISNLLQDESTIYLTNK